MKKDTKSALKNSLLRSAVEKIRRDAVGRAKHSTKSNKRMS